MIVKCAWCGKDMGEKPPYEDKSITHGICDECYRKAVEDIKPKEGGESECKKEKPTGKELTRFAMKLVAVMRGHSAGTVSVPKLKGWTKEDLEGTADLLLKDLREGRTEELERLYLETCGEPFDEVRYIGE